MVRKVTPVFLLLICFFAGSPGQAQKVDTLYFNLYTDSLKKGTFNYINVEGKLDNGHYLPLTEAELNFSCPDGRFEGNSLYIDTSFTGKKVVVTVKLKADTTRILTKTIYIKTFFKEERLKTKEEVMEDPRGKTRKSRKKKNDG